VLREPSGSTVPFRFGGNKELILNVELEFPIFQEVGIRGVLFYDAGNVWASASGFNPTRLFRGAGVGVALITPLGPLGLDYAYGFDRTDRAGNPRPGWKLHFKIGNFF
jgi:outer membrane protein insertion porin family